MRFKRPQLRYADTPQPATPYQAAGQVWDERIGSARVQAKNWRFMALGCLTLAVQADGGQVQTIEGLSASGVIRDLQDAFVRRNALQCGFCTSGMLMAAKELVEQMPHANRAEVREWISGNYCRCTGYHAIVDAICDVLQQRKEIA